MKEALFNVTMIAAIPVAVVVILVTGIVLYSVITMEASIDEAMRSAETSPLPPETGVAE